MPPRSTADRNGATMMGTKERRFLPLAQSSLEDLVPADHFYHHLERSLDLGFVRDLVGHAYAESGRPSIDPIVFFKLQLVMFFEGLRSERQLIETTRLNLARRLSGTGVPHGDPPARPLARPPLIRPDQGGSGSAVPTLAPGHDRSLPPCCFPCARGGGGGSVEETSGSDTGL